MIFTAILCCAYTYNFNIAAKLLEELIAYARQFSQKIGHHFTKKTIRLTAMTGCAAMEIGGETTARVFKYLQKNDHATQADLEDFADTRMNIIDEISFAKTYFNFAGKN